MLIIVPRSFCENQCVITRPHGGHPIPLNHPTSAFSTPITAIASVLCSAPIALIGTIMKHIAIAESTNPSGRNTRAFDRSLTLPIRNFENAYPAAFRPSTKPSSDLKKPSGSIDGIAIERFFLTR